MNINIILDKESPFTWVDGSDFGDNAYKNWNEGEPNFGKDDTAYCAYISSGDGHWDDNICQEQPHRLICKKKKDQAEGITNFIFLYYQCCNKYYENF